MAAKNALALYAGEIEELRPGDTLNGAGGGGSVNAGVALLDFGVDGEDASVIITGQAAIAAGSIPLVCLAAVATAENTPDEIWADPPMVLAGDVVPGTGFTIFGRARQGSLHGNIPVNWSWATP